MTESEDPTPATPSGSTGPALGYVLAVDLGTGGPKVALVSVEGDVVGHEHETNDLILTDDGGVEQDPEQWWTSIVTATRRLLARRLVPTADVVAIAITSQWMTTVAVDADGRHVGNAISWMDTRGARYAQAASGGGVVVPTVGYNAKKLRQWLRLTGGVPSRTGKDPVGQMLFLKHERPEVYEATAVFLEPMDYLNLRLTGRAVSAWDTIVGHWVTDNRDLHHVGYDDELIEWVGVDRDKLPELVPTGSIIGSITEVAAAELGLGPHVQVVAGTGDTASAGIGSGAVRDFEGHLYIGTSSWLSCHVPFKKTDLLSNITSLPSGIPRRYWVATEQDTAGKCLSWLIDNVLYPDDALGSGPAPDDIFDRLNTMAASVEPGSGNVIFLPWLNGERTPVDNHLIRAGWFNASLATERAQLVRAVFEGVALNTRWMCDAAEKFTKRPFEHLNFVGGGARSPLWCQIIADVLDRPIRQVADPVLANARGAGFSAAVALGHLRWEDIPARITITQTFQPNPRNRATYDRLYATFTDLYKKNKGLYARLNRHSKHA
jgi:xylulokinase